MNIGNGPCLDEDVLTQDVFFFFPPKAQPSFSLPLNQISVNNSFVLSFISCFYETCIVLVRNVHKA